MPSKKFHKQVISKLKTALREARDCFVFYKNITRRTAESNRMLIAKHQLSFKQRPEPSGDILHILRNSYSNNKNSSPQDGGAIYDALQHAVSLLKLSDSQYNKHSILVKRNHREFVIPPNETREVVDVIADNTIGNYPSVFTIRAEKNARVTYIFAVFGEREITKDVTLELEEGAEGRIVGVIIASGKAHFTLKTTLRHKAPQTLGDIKIKMVLKDTAYVSYDGLIKIDKPAQQTNSYLDARALILDRGAVCEGKPELEIEADDVKASHAFSSGKIDSEQLFYLRSRGLSEGEAKRMIVRGFLMEAAKGLSKQTQEKIISEMTVLNK